MSEKVTCTRCGEEFESDEMHEFDGEFLCADCYENDTFVCSLCGDRRWNDDNEGDDNTQICQRCYDYSYTHCVDCGRLIHIDDAYYLDDDDDQAYCCNCYDRKQNYIHLHDYNFKPDPIFYGKGNRYFGIEIEVDNAGKDSHNAEILENITNQSSELIYIKADGSLDCGLEIVSHPMSLDYHINSMPWLDIMNKALELGYLSHKTNTCGTHIHVNRNTFGDEITEQEACISRVLYFFERFWQEMLKFSRRTESALKRWANRYGYRQIPKEILDTAKTGYQGRYSCVNITNYATIEIRMFRGTLKYNTLIAALQMVNEICEAAILLSDEELTSMSWCEFVERIDKEKNSQLIQYLKERRLYINEPIEMEDEV